MNGRSMLIKERAEMLNLLPSSDPIQTGDIYLAERHTGPKLLTCERVVMNSFGEPSYIVPVEMAYCFNAWECVKMV